MKYVWFKVSNNIKEAGVQLICRSQSLTKFFSSSQSRYAHQNKHVLSPRLTGVQAQATMRSRFTIYSVFLDIKKITFLISILLYKEFEGFFISI